MNQRVAQVAVAVPLRRVFDYLVPAAGMQVAAERHPHATAVE